MVSDIASQSMVFLCLCRFLNLDVAGCKRILACYYKKITLRWLVPEEVALKAFGYYATKQMRSRKWMVSLGVRATHRSGWAVPLLNTEHLHHISLFEGEQRACEAVAATLGAWQLPTIRTEGWNAWARTYPQSAIRVQIDGRIWRQLNNLMALSAVVWFWSTKGGRKLHCSL